MYLYPTAAAAMILGVTPETLRSWRRRGMGPSYVKERGGYARGRGSFILYYPEEKLKAFIDARLVPCGRLPRPMPGRLPGGNYRRDGSGPGTAPCTTDMENLHLWNTDLAAMYLGVDVETLCSWRRRGIGPAYARFPGGHVRRGAHHWEKKTYGHIRYPLHGLQAFLERLKVQEGRLPRPMPGRRKPSAGAASDNQRL